MEEGEGYTRRWKIVAHGKMEIDVVCTNEEATLVQTLAIYEKWLEVDDHKFVGLDLEYTKERPKFEQELAVIQLTMRTHVLFYHFCWIDKLCPTLCIFHQDKGIVFTTVDKRKDWWKLHYAKNKIPDNNWIDIQTLVKIQGSEKGDGMAKMAKHIIDSSYGDMKEDFPTVRHDYWEEKPLSNINLKYAAIDGYVSYELYVRILFFQRYMMVPAKEVDCPYHKRASDAYENACTSNNTEDASTSWWYNADAQAAAAAANPVSKWDQLAAEQKWIAPKSNWYTTWPPTWQAPEVE